MAHRQKGTKELREISFPKMFRWCCITAHMETTGTSPRRLLAIASFIIAIVFGPLTLLWYWAKSLSNPEDVYPFLGVAFVHLAAAVAFVLTAKTHWRWALLLISLPCALEFFERSFELWRWSHY